MPIITFTTRSTAGDAINVISMPQRAKLAQLGGEKRVISFPYGPQGVSYSDMGLEYSTIDRPGLAPMLMPTSKKKRTLSVVAVLATPSDFGKTSVEDTLSIFGAIADEDEDCAFTYGVVTLPYRVRVTSFSYTAIHRDADGNTTQAEVTLQLDERIIINQSIVALKAISYPPDPVASTAKKSSSTSSAPATKAPTAEEDDDIDLPLTDVHEPVKN